MAAYGDNGRFRIHQVRKASVILPKGNAAFREYHVYDAYGSDIAVRVGVFDTAEDAKQFCDNLESQTP